MALFGFGRQRPATEENQPVVKPKCNRCNRDRMVRCHHCSKTRKTGGVGSGTEGRCQDDDCVDGLVPCQCHANYRGSG